MKQYSYQTKEIPKMLFTELVLAYAICNKEDFYSEITRRLEFCGFEPKMIKQLITYELEILKRTNKQFDRLLINKKWWLDNIVMYSNKNLLEYPLEQYLLYYNGNMSTTALTNSEIVSIFDEANFIKTNSSNFPDSIVEECEALSSSDSKTNLKDEFIHRIDYIYKRELNTDYDQKMFKKIMRFFINESHILFLYKYNYAKDEELKWEPYTDEFLKYYNY